MARDDDRLPVEKLAQLADLLRSTYPRKWTADELSQRLNIHKRSIYRQLRSVDATLVPLLNEKGQWWAAERPATLSNLQFEPEELTTLMLCLHSVSHKALRDRAQGILDKIRRTLGAARQQQVDRLASRITLRMPGDDAKDVTHILAALSEAIVSEVSVDITYQSLERAQPVERRVDPWGLFFHAGAWYFTGHDHLRDRRRTFRASRVVDLKLTQEHVRPSDFVADQVIYHPWDPQSEDGTPERVSLDIGPELARWLQENPMHSGQQITAEGARYRFQVEVKRPEKMIGWILGLRDIQVLEPESLRAAVAAQAEDIRRRHDGLR